MKRDKHKTRVCFHLQALDIPEKGTTAAALEKEIGGHGRVMIGSPGCSKWQPKMTVMEVADIANRNAELRITETQDTE